MVNTNTILSDTNYKVKSKSMPSRLVKYIHEKTNSSELKQTIRHQSVTIETYELLDQSNVICNFILEVSIVYHFCPSGLWVN